MNFDFCVFKVLQCIWKQLHTMGENCYPTTKNKNCSCFPFVYLSYHYTLSIYMSVPVLLNLYPYSGLFILIHAVISLPVINVILLFITQFVFISDILSKTTKTLDFLRRNLALAPRITGKLLTKLWYALHWSIQHLFGAQYVKLRFNRWRRYRGRQPAGPAGGGATLVVLLRCLMSCNCQLLGPRGISPLCFSSTRFIVGLCLLIKIST